jgi:hypothetical protein
MAQVGQYCCCHRLTPALFMDAISPRVDPSLSTAAFRSLGGGEPAIRATAMRSLAAAITLLSLSAARVL